jgi:hypothetical protein
MLLQSLPMFAVVSAALYRTGVWRLLILLTVALNIMIQCMVTTLHVLRLATLSVLTPSHLVLLTLIFCVMMIESAVVYAR